MLNDDAHSSRRHRSRRHLLDAIRRESGVTRADLSLLTGLSRSTVAEGVQDLLDERLITEDVNAPGGRGAGRGRPSALLVPTAPPADVVGIDISHHHIAVAVANTKGVVLTEQRSRLNVDTQARAALDVAAGMVFRALNEAGLTTADVRCVGVGIPAPLDQHTKLIRSTSIMSDWVGLNPEDELARLLGCRVVSANDADMGAYGELRFGAARGLRDFVYVKVSEGVGASLFLNGAAYHGALGLAGEVGHTQLDGQGTWCRCGNRGCLETIISTEVIRSRMRTGFAPPDDPSFPLAEVARDVVVGRIVAEAGRTLGRVLADVCNWLNPAAIVVGGELGTAGEPVVDGIRESINRYAQPAMADTVSILPAQLGLRSELLGAVATASRNALYLA